MCLEFNFTYAVQISSGSVNKYVIIENFIENDQVHRKNKIWNKPWRVKYHTRAYCPLIRCIDNSRTGLDTSKNQCSAPAVTTLKNYWRYHVFNLFRLKNSSNVFAFIIIIIGCVTGNIIHDQLKLRPCFLPWVSKNRRYRILKGIDRLSDFIFIIDPRSLKFCRRM